MKPIVRLASVLLVPVLFACSGSDNRATSNGGSGGSQGLGGGGGNTGGASNAGTAQTGGASTSSGGGTSGASNSTTGGASNSATGGAPATGGASNSTTGGAPGTGGTRSSATGGVPGTGGATGAGGSATGGKGATGGSATGGSTGCSDTCPTSSTGYIAQGCKKRFMYGVNYAWQNFGTDFGGFAKWSQSGVAAAKSTYQNAIQDMKDNGVDVIRWWMFPNLDNTDGIAWNGDNATGLGSTTAADIQAALDIAATVGVHIQLTLFSFDDFKTANTRRMDNIITDSTKLANLINNAVKPVAAAVESSANKDRLISWDVVNEPEWAITGNDGYGDQDFGADSTCSPVAFTTMETFVKNVVTSLHANSSAPVSVGGAAVKWAKAWSKVGVDFYTFHVYGWVNDWYPYDQPPSYYNINDLQVNIGEFPLAGLPASTQRGTGAVDFVTMVNKLFSVGYAGAQAWAVTDSSDPTFSWSANKASVKAFSDAKGCMVHY